MIERSIETTLAPIREELRGQRELIASHDRALDALIARVEACEQSDHQATDFVALRVDIVGLRRDLDELKSTYIFMLWGWS